MVTGVLVLELRLKASIPTRAMAAIETRVVARALRLSLNRPGLVIFLGFGVGAGDKLGLGVEVEDEVEEVDEEDLDDEDLDDEDLDDEDLDDEDKSGIASRLSP